MGEEIAKAIGAILLIAFTVFFISTLYGTILYWIYPHIHSVFPSAANNGIIARELSWWDSVCISWIFSILIKSSVTNNNNKN